MFDMIMFYQINYWSILLASIVYFVIGMLWFAPSAFGTIWRKELERHRVTLPGSHNMTLSMVITFLSCVATAKGLFFMIQLLGCQTAMSGFLLGCAISAFFVIPPVATIFVWEHRSIKLFLIDVGYPVLGTIISAIILTLWQ